MNSEGCIRCGVTTRLAKVTRQKKEVWGEGYEDGINLWKGEKKKGKEGLYKIEGLETQPTKSFVCVASFWVTS